MRLKELFDMAAKGAEVLFAQSGEVLPMLHAVRKDGTPVFIPLIWRDRAEKFRTFDQLRRALPAFGVKQYAIISEAWIVECRSAKSLDEAEAYYREAPLEEHPDRREALTITAADNRGNVLAGYYYILRPEHGPPKLSPLRLDAVAETVGDFTDLLI